MDAVAEVDEEVVEGEGAEGVDSAKKIKAESVHKRIFKRRIF